MVNPETIVRLERVSKTYPGGQGVRALDNLDLEIKKRERVAIMGPSGSGKSTLLNLICGLDVPTAGHIYFEEVELSKLTDNECTRLRREKIGMIFQTFNLLPTLTALENVALPLRLKGCAKREAEERASAFLDRVGLRERALHRPDEMSGGEHQRTAIARALIFRPPLVLADEPTGNLDSRSGEEILELLTELHRELGTTILLVTHNASAAAQCNRQIKLLDGRIESDEKRPEGILEIALETV